MDITFLIGNGFDLNLGLKTTYQDFLKYYCSEENCPSNNDEIKKCKEGIGKDCKIWCDFEIAIEEYSNNFTPESLKTYIDFHLNVCIELSKYLKIEEKKICTEDLIEKVADTLSESLMNITEGIKPDVKKTIDTILNPTNSIHYHFINFNYTKTLKDILEIFTEKNKKIGQRQSNGGNPYNIVGSSYHIHGTAGSQDMILGVNDISQITNAELFAGENGEYLVNFIKTESNRDNGMEKENICFDLIEKSKIIYVYGMSMGYTDKIWWQKIYQNLNRNPDKCIIIDEYDEIDYGLLENLNERRTKIKNVQNAFLKHSNVEVPYGDPIRDRIHVILNTNIFSPLKGLVSKIYLEKEGFFNRGKSP